MRHGRRRRSVLPILDAIACEVSTRADAAVAKLCECGIVQLARALKIRDRQRNMVQHRLHGANGSTLSRVAQAADDR